MSRKAWHFRLSNYYYPNTIKEFQHRFKIENLIETGTEHAMNQGSTPINIFSNLNIHS